MDESAHDGEIPGRVILLSESNSSSTESDCWSGMPLRVGDLIAVDERMKRPGAMYMLYWKKYSKKKKLAGMCPDDDLGSVLLVVDAYHARIVDWPTDLHFDDQTYETLSSRPLGIDVDEFAPEIFKLLIFHFGAEQDDRHLVELMDLTTRVRYWMMWNDRSKKCVERLGGQSER